MTLGRDGRHARRIFLSPDRRSIEVGSLYWAWSRSSLPTSQGDFPAGVILDLGWGYSEYSQYSQYPDYPSLDQYFTQFKERPPAQLVWKN